MRGVILAGGYGTRMAPCTKVTNKHLLPVYTEAGAVPMIHFPIRTLVKSGIENILIISSRHHSGDIIEHLGDGEEFGADFSYKVQDMDRVQLGIASALKIARDYTKDDNMAVILGDNYFEESFKTRFTQFDIGQIDCYSLGFLKTVSDPTRFGVILWKDTNFTEVLCIYEKPKNPPSNWAVTGLYLFKPQVYELLDGLKPSRRGELEIIDILNMDIQQNKFSHCFISGFWSDMGTPESMKKTQDFINQEVI